MIFKINDCAMTTHRHDDLGKNHIYDLNVKMFGVGFLIVEEDSIPEELEDYIIAKYDVSYKEYKEKFKKHENHKFSKYVGVYGGRPSEYEREYQL